MLLHELPNVVSKVQKPFPLLYVQRDRHPLESVDADGTLLTDLAVE
jgi:hypothetical protein